VLKNDVANGGSGGFIVFDAVNDIESTLVKVQSCQAFIDRDNRTNAGAYFSFHHGSKLLDNWMLIGTNRGFYFLCSPSYLENSGNNSFGGLRGMFFWVGDFSSLHQNDPSTFIAMSGLKNSDQFTSSAPLNNKLASTSATDVVDIYSLDSSRHQSHDLSTIFGNEFYVSGGQTDEPEINSMVECFIIVSEFTAIENFNKVDMPAVRGKLPGLFFTPNIGFYNNSVPFIKKINNVDHFNVPNVQSNTTGAWINLEQW
jgi:hypothetical protein